MSKIPLVMKTWAGEAPHDMDYITRSIPSLLTSDLPDNIEIVIYDDCSPNPALKDYLGALARNDKRVRIIFGEQNKGPNLGQQDIYRQIVAEYPDAPFYLNADDDVVYHREWLNRLTDAYEACRRMGRNGVFTALHMPFRRHFESIDTAGLKLYLKWKQPALNWLIPRDLYEDIGSFRDEGIAYDTVYSHWMRLKGYPIFCMSPSYVQNIGLLGAYATDDKTTALDFAVFSPMQQLQYQLGYHVRRIPDYLRHMTDPAAEIVWPVRWGTEFVHEGVRRDGTSVAVCTFNDALRLGWQAEDAARRVEQVASAYARSKLPQLAPKLFRNRKGVPVRVEIPWRFMPNLREAVAFNLPKQPTPRELFQALLEQLAPLHKASIVHNKVRPENVYVDQQTGDIHLLWLGVEPYPGHNLAALPPVQRTAMLSGALNRWAQRDVREMFAQQFLGVLAPETQCGNAPSTQSDLYSAAAVVVRYLQSRLPEVDLQALALIGTDELIARGVASNDPLLTDALERCLQHQPDARPRCAIQAMEMLDG